MSFNGDYISLIRLIFLEKNDITFGVLIGLLLLVVVLMLIRSVVEEKNGGSGGVAEIDSKSLGVAVEGAVKKALSEKTIVTEVAAAPADGGAGATSAESAELKKTLNEREAKIAALMSDLEVMKSQVAAAPEAGAGGGAAAPAGDVLALHTKINELQAKLSEYEIIEDDIADLSSFKEENKRLKEELEQLRSTGAVAAPVAAAPVVEAPPAPAAPVAPVEAAPAAAPTEDSAASVDAFAAELAGHVDPPIVEKPAAPAPAAAEPFKLDTSDDVMGEFAAALSGGAAKPEDKSDDLVVSNQGAAVEDPQAAIDALLAGADSKPAEAKPAAPVEENKDESVDAFAKEVASTPEPAVAARPNVASEVTTEVTTDVTTEVAVEANADEAAAAPASEAASGESATAEADPFGPLDTEKMLEEVASMKEDGGDGSSVLDDQLDTDRLMAEMGMTESAKSEAAPEPAEDDPTAEFAAAVAGKAPPVAESAAMTMTPPTPPAPEEVPESEVPVDDLLAEFKDTEFQAKKG